MEIRKPDSVLNDIYLDYDDGSKSPRCYIGVPLNFSAPLKQGQAHRSKVAAGGIGRFTAARLCSSQVLSLQDLSLISYAAKKSKHQLLLVGAYAPSPVLDLSGLSCPPATYVAVGELIIQFPKNEAYFIIF